MCLALCRAIPKEKIRWALSSVAFPGVTSHKAEICSCRLRYRCYNKMVVWREFSASCVKAAWGNRQIPGLSTGQNMSISPDQLQQVFGSSAIGDLASQLGLSKDQAGSTMAQLFPEVINQLTPQGQVPDNGDDEIAEGLSMLANGELLRRV